MYELLMEIKKIPGIYIGSLSLEKLATFLSGYICCRRELKADGWDDFYEFQNFVEREYHANDGKNWSTLIEDRFNKGESAFAEFYRLIDLYYKKL